MEIRHKILLVDDDPDLLEVYRETFALLPSQPEVHTAPSGARAIAMLEADPYRLLVTDLKMPKMDGLQLLSIVRRKFPELRTVVLTSVVDEQFRSRVYALGVDLYWHKPGTEPEMKQFLECLESLLGRESEPGFRGMQSKSLMDLVQLECISQSSSVLRITNGPFVGSIWVNNGELIDAETEAARGEEAFQKILRWRTGNFEFLPAEPSRARTIFKSYNALLLETAQAFDEASNTDNSAQCHAGPGLAQRRYHRLDGAGADRRRGIRAANHRGNQGGFPRPGKPRTPRRLDAARASSGSAPSAKPCRPVRWNKSPAWAGNGMSRLRKKARRPCAWAGGKPSARAKSATG